MPLKFDSEAAYERWVRERERAEMGSPIGAPGAQGRAYRRRLAADRMVEDRDRPLGRRLESKPKPSRVRHHLGRPVRHVTRKGHRRRAQASLRTFFRLAGL